ncbi:hypothetical protein OA07_24600 [Aphanizomenon flos-aquae 2012/KM1/D3]|nr:hypothetical protein OA07_24600 [Aphanizomenon flos-aquae 2012/KM1/D3]
MIFKPENVLLLRATTGSKSAHEQVKSQKSKTFQFDFWLDNWGLLLGLVSIVVADIADYALIDPYPIKMSKQYENS